MSRSILILFISISLLFFQQAYAQKVLELSFSTDKEEYAVGEEITVTGSVSKIIEGNQVIIRVFNPKNIAYSFAQMDVNEERSFSYKFVVGGKLGIAGEYTVNVNYAVATESKTITLTPSEKASYTIRFAGEVLNVMYEMKNAGLQSIEVDPEFLSIILFIKSDEEIPGSLEITLPRQLLDAKKDARDSNFFVFVDGEESTYNEIRATEQSRTLFIEFPEGTTDIEIVGTSVIPEFPANLILPIAIGSVIAVMLMIRKRSNHFPIIHATQT